MTKPDLRTNPSKPVVVLYAMNDGKGRAGVFRGADVEPALKAARLLKFSVLPGEADEVRKLSRELPPGRIQAKGPNIAPFIRRDLFEKLTALRSRNEPATSKRRAAAKGKSRSQPPKQQKRTPACRSNGRTSTGALLSSSKTRIPPMVGGRASSPKYRAI